MCRSSPYLSVGRNKFWKRNHVKAHYAFKEQVAMVDFTYNENAVGDEPLAKVCCPGICKVIMLLLAHLYKTTLISQCHS